MIHGVREAQGELELVYLLYIHHQQSKLRLPMVWLTLYIPATSFLPPGLIMSFKQLCHYLFFTDSTKLNNNFDYGQRGSNK
jgi:hypothetical protein